MQSCVSSRTCGKVLARLGQERGTHSGDTFRGYIPGPVQKGRVRDDKKTIPSPERAVREFPERKGPAGKIQQGRPPREAWLLGRAFVRELWFVSVLVRVKDVVAVCRQMRPSHAADKLEWARQTLLQGLGLEAVSWRLCPGRCVLDAVSYRMWSLMPSLRRKMWKSSLSPRMRKARSRSGMLFTAERRM